MKKIVFVYVKRECCFPVATVPIDMQPPANLPLGLACVKAYAAADAAIAAKAALTGLSFGESLSEEQIAASLAAQRPDVAAFSFFLLNVGATLEVCRRLKAKLPGVKIVVGGADVPKDPVRLAGFLEKNPAIDAAVFGEGEVPFAGWLKAYLAGAAPAPAPGLAVRDGKKISAGRGTSVPDLRLLPSPYLTGTLKLNKKPGGVLTLEASRGCPFSCAYCAGDSTQRAVRYFPPERFRKEMAWLKKMRYTGIIWLTDPIMNVDPGRSAEVFRLLAASRANFALNIDLEFLDDKQIELMGKIPSLATAIGIQTINPAAMRRMGRVPEFKSGAEKIRKLQQKGITVILQLILGLPGDNYETFKASLDWVLNFGQPLRCDVYDLVLLTNSRLSFMPEKFSIKANAEKIVTANCSFSAGDLARASRLVAVLRAISREHSTLALFESAFRREGRPSRVLERLALKARREGLIPGRRLFIKRIGTYEAIPAAFLKAGLSPKN